MHVLCFGNGPTPSIMNPKRRNKKKDRFHATWIWAHAIVPWSPFLGCWASIGLMPMFIKWVDFESTTLTYMYMQSGWLILIYWHSTLFLKIFIYHKKRKWNKYFVLWLLHKWVNEIMIFLIWFWSKVICMR